MATSSWFQFAHPRYWLTWFGLALLRLVLLLPYRWQLKVGRCLGRCLYRLEPKRRHVVEVNLKLCFPELTDEQRSIKTRRVFEENAVGLLETAMAWWTPAAMLNRPVTLKGAEYLQQAQQQGDGVILLSAHFTMLDLGGLLLSQYFPLDGVYRQHNNLLFDRVIRQGREGFLQQAIERNNMRQMVKRLRAGSFIWYAPDQDHGPVTSVFAPFFGIEAATVTGTARLAKMSRAKVMGYRFHRTDNGYELEITPAMDNFPSGDDVADASAVNQLLEDAIRKVPEQYMWVHRRFKTHPKGKNYLYQQHTKD